MIPSAPPPARAAAADTLRQQFVALAAAVDDPLERYRMERALQQEQTAAMARQYHTELQPRPTAAQVQRDQWLREKAVHPVDQYLQTHRSARDVQADAVRAREAQEAAERATAQETAEVTAQLAQCVEAWKTDRALVDTCRANLQQARLHLRDSEQRLKQHLHSPLLVDMPAPQRGRADDGSSTRPQFVSVAQIELKKALTARVVRRLLCEHMGAEDGEKLFTHLMDNRETAQREQVVVRAATKKRRGADKNEEGKVLPPPPPPPPLP